MRNQAKQIRIRATPEDAARWKQSAESAGLTLSDYFRTGLGAQPVGRDPVKNRPVRKADPLLLATLGRIAGNLNQIAKWANTHKKTADAVQVLIALRAIEDQIADFKPKYGVKNADPDV